MITRILLADDHSVLRSGLRLLLESNPNFQVVGEASTGFEALAIVEELQPDLVLLDLSMPGLGGLDVLPHLKEALPRVKILILTMYEDSQYLKQAIQHGASGYILKKAVDVELISAIDTVMHGEMYVHPSMTKSLLEDLLPNSGENEGLELWDSLSDREQEVLKLVALGHTSAEIAGQLSLSTKTVETYRARGMEKLGLRTRAALVRYALKSGLISGE
jgi:two-component system, NarL family, response regulator NreC